MAEKGPPEKRKYPRLEGITFPVEYALKEKADIFRRARAISVAESGFMLIVDDPLSMGAHLQIKLYLPRTLFPFSNWQAIVVEAKVIRLEGPVDSSGLRRYGVLITHISDQDTACLKNYVYLAGWMREKIKSQQKMFVAARVVPSSLRFS